MPLWSRFVEFLMYWVLFGGAALFVCAVANRAARSSCGEGIAARVVGSMVLGTFGFFIDLHHVVTLGVIMANNYQALLPLFGWCMWAAGLAGAAIPWLARERKPRTPNRDLDGDR